MNQAAQYKFWLTAGLLFVLLIVLSAVVFITAMPDAFKGAVIAQLLDAFGIMIYFLYRKGNPAEKTTVAPLAGDLGSTGSTSPTAPKAPAPAVPEIPEIPEEDDLEDDEEEPEQDNPNVPTPAATEAKIKSDIDPEDAAGLAMKFRNEMDILWGYMSAGQREAYLGYAIALAKEAWKAFIGVTTGGEPPTNYRAMEPESLYYANLKKACGDKWNPTATRSTIDTLHDLLELQATGMW